MFPSAVYGIIIDKIIYDIKKIKGIIDMDRIYLNIEQANSYLDKLKKCEKQNIGFDTYRMANRSSAQLSCDDGKIVNINIKEVKMRDFNYGEQVGIQGSKAGKKAQVTQVYNKVAEGGFNYDAIIDEIVLIRNYLKDQDENDQNYILIGELAKLNQATIKKDDKKIIDILKECGKQIIDISKRIGCSILATYITHTIGI